MGMVCLMVHADRYTSRPAQLVHGNRLCRGDLSRYSLHHRVGSGSPSSIQTVLPSKDASLVGASIPFLDQSDVEVPRASNEKSQTPQHIPEACVAYHGGPEQGNN